MIKKKNIWKQQEHVEIIELEHLETKHQPKLGKFQTSSITSYIQFRCLGSKKLQNMAKLPYY